MTPIIDFKQSSHLNPALTDPAQAKSSGERLIGRWVNTNHETKGIAECVIAQDGDHYSVKVFGAGEDGLIEWPTAGAKPLANLEEEAGQRTVALAAEFDFGFMRAETHIRINKGVLVIVLFITFKDYSGRSNYLNREFFYRND
ncbi:MAG: hypothetical protein H7Z16_17035 [Pyrinomonadaceae bacterium]|nr:hypothetical protein [Pyrinomonadaceae bacterium]